MAYGDPIKKKSGNKNLKSKAAKKSAKSRKKTDLQKKSGKKQPRYSF